MVDQFNSIQGHATTWGGALGKLLEHFGTGKFLQAGKSLSKWSKVIPAWLGPAVSTATQAAKSFAEKDPWLATADVLFVAGVGTLAAIGAGAIAGSAAVVALPVAGAVAVVVIGSYATSMAANWLSQAFTKWNQ